MKLDLGCGSCKHPGFFGMDIRSADRVDLVADLNKGIPLPDRSVEMVMASRVLPYVNDLFAVLSEIYRVSVHKAVLCVLAPYAHSFRHASNPHLIHKFDEYTPRYWTGHFFQPSQGAVSPAVPYYCDFEAPFDFRLIRMELFYSAAYRDPIYEPEELETLLQLQANVADEIMYHFAIVKEEITPEELEQLSRQTHPEPVHAAALRKREEFPAAAEEEEGDPVRAAAPSAPDSSGGRSRAPRGFGKKKASTARGFKKRSRYSPRT